MSPEEELIYYQKAYAREKAARKEAERILESKAEELYDVNKKLLSVNANLEQNLIKRTEQIKEAEQHYRQLVETANDVIFRADLNGNFTYVNHTGIRLSGYNIEELLEKNFTFFVEKEFQDEMIKLYRDQLENEISSTYFEYKLINQSKEAVWLGQNVQLIYKDGYPIEFLAVARDVTARVKNDKAIIRSEEKYRGIIENLEFGLLEVNTEGLIEKAYPSFCKLTGYEPIDLIGTDPYAFLHPDFHEEMDNRTLQREAGISNVYEVKIRQKSGAYKWVIISAAPYYDENGEYQGSVGVHLDISDQKKMESDLIDANQIAQASSKAKELFLANMSHEIRTPLNAVIGLSNLLKNTELNEVQTKFTANIYNSAQSLILLVNDILDISKIESGKIEVNTSTFNLNQSVKTILSSCSYLAEKKNLELALEIDNDLHGFYAGDELKICQILINLLNNAIKFTTEGKVTLRIDNVQKKGDLHEIKFSVKDTGKGIAEEALNTIFEDFSQEDDTISKKFGGTGLGLSISEKLVNILGGKLAVQSKLEKGTTFSFSVDLEPINKELMIDLKEVENQTNWESIKILTVEDNPVNQFVVKSTIESWGGKTAIASDGQEAITMLLKEDFDIVLMDMQMPVMDGITATKIIRQELKLTIPILAFTANALKSEMEKCFAVGMDDYISKPFQEEQLKSKIHNLISQSSDQNIQPIKQEGIQKDKTKSLFTLERLEKLSRGNKDFIRRMLDIFLEDGSAQLEQMSVSVDPEELARLAHKIKPSIDYISNNEMKELVRNIEQKQFIETPELLEEFILKLKALIIEVNLFQKQ